MHDTCMTCGSELTAPVPIPIVHYGKGIYALDSVQGFRCSVEACSGGGHVWLAVGRLGDLADETSERPLFAHVDCETREWHRVDPPPISAEILAAQDLYERDYLADSALASGDVAALPALLHVIGLPETAGHRTAVMRAIRGLLDVDFPSPQSARDIVHGHWGALVDVVCGETFEAACDAVEVLAATVLPRPLRPHLQEALSQADPRHWRAEIISDLLNRTIPPRDDLD